MTDNQDKKQQSHQKKMEKLKDNVDASIAAPTLSAVCQFCSPAMAKVNLVQLSVW